MLVNLFPFFIDILNLKCDGRQITVVATGRNNTGPFLFSTAYVKSYCLKLIFFLEQMHLFLSTNQLQ